MSHARELGFAIHERVAGSQEREQQIRETLHITPHELEKLYSGRLFLTGADLRKVASVCGVEARELTGASRERYDKTVVRYMTAFQKRENREKILDLIDAYIDAREALEED